MSKANAAIPRLIDSDYLSPYFRSGAPNLSYSNAENDKYAGLRAKALKTLEAMAFEPQTMVERGVAWAEDQDPFGHVMHTQYLHYFGLCWQRVMESYQEFLSEDDYQGMINAKTVIPVVNKYELRIKRQVKYPDSLIIAFREDNIEPSRNHGTTVVFSLQQQAVVAETKGTVTFVDAKTGRPVDIRKAGAGWLRFYEGFSEKAVAAKALRDKWEQDHPIKTKAKI